MIYRLLKMILSEQKFQPPEAVYTGSNGLRNGEQCDESDSICPIQQEFPVCFQEYIQEILE